MKNAIQKEDQLHLSVYYALEGLGIAVHKSKKAKNKRRRSCVKPDFARGRLCSASCEKEDYPFIASPKQKLFGIALNSVEWDMDCNGFYAPKFLIMSTEYLLSHQKCEGLFRKPGASNRLKALKTLLEDGGNLRTIGVSHVYDVACILKQWLRELPEPLIPYAFHEVFLKCYDIKSEEDRLKALCLVCLLLPSEHLRTLMYVLKFLSAIAVQDLNKMDAHNLAIVISPCLMPLPKLSMDGEATKLLLESRSLITQLLITHSDVIGKTDWLEETLAKSHRVSHQGESGKRETLKPKSTSKSVHGIFHNLRRRINSTQSPSPQLQNPTKFERPLFYSQRRDKQKQKCKKILHASCTMDEFKDLVNVPKNSLKSPNPSLQETKKLVNISKSGDGVNALEIGSLAFSPLLNITNSSFAKDSPFSRPNKFRLENERTCLQSNSTALNDAETGRMQSNQKEGESCIVSASCQTDTPVIPRFLVRQTCHRSRSLQCGNIMERQILGSSKNLHVHKSSHTSVALKKSHYMKAKRRRDSVHNMRHISNLVRSTSSPASCLDVLRATARLQSQISDALQDGSQNMTLTSNTLYSTGSKYSLRRGRPNTVSSGLPSPAWTRTELPDPVDIACLSRNETISVLQDSDQSLSPTSEHSPKICNTEEYDSGNNKTNDLQTSSHMFESATCLSTMPLNASKCATSTAVQHKETMSRSNLNSSFLQAVESTITREESLNIHGTPSDSETDLEGKSNANNIADQDFPTNSPGEQWSSAAAYFKLPESQTKPRNACSSVRESILLLRTKNAGRVQANIQLFDNISSAFSVPTERNAISCTSRNRHSFSCRSSTFASSRLYKEQKCETSPYLDVSKAFSSDEDSLKLSDSFFSRSTCQVSLPRALFDYSSDLTESDTFANTDNLLLSKASDHNREKTATTEELSLNEST